jgi:hypothetical protein
MRKVIAAINMTLDGFCDHTAGLVADEELHYHYAELLNNAGVIIWTDNLPTHAILANIIEESF